MLFADISESGVLYQTLGDTALAVHPGDEVAAAYDAPFPSRKYQAGARAFPRLVPTDPDDVAVPERRRWWQRWIPQVKEAA